MSKILNLLAPFIPNKNSSDGYSNLCQTCSSIFRGNRKDKPLGVTGRHPLNQTLQELQSSAENGCHLCYIRWNDLSAADKLALRGCVKVNFGFWESRVGNGLAFEYFYAIQPLEERTPCLTRSLLFKPVDGVCSHMLEFSRANS
jgi:hypothetical protein